MKKILWLSIIGLVIGYSFFNIYPNIVSINQNDIYEQYMLFPEYKEFVFSGELIRNLKAKSWSMYEKEYRSDLNEVDFYYNSWRLISNKATVAHSNINNNIDTIEFVGNVVIYGLDNLKIETKKLMYDNRSKQIKSNSHATFISDKLDLSGDGFILNLNDNRLEISGNVNSIYILDKDN